MLRHTTCASPIAATTDPSIVFIGQRSTMSRVACVTLTPPEASHRTGFHPKAQFGAYSGLGRKAQPSVMEALPPVGWLSTVAQPAHMTAVWAWEKTVVLRLQVVETRARIQAVDGKRCSPGGSEFRHAGNCPFPTAQHSMAMRGNPTLGPGRPEAGSLTWRSSPGSARP